MNATLRHGWVQVPIVVSLLLGCAGPASAPRPADPAPLPVTTMQPSVALTTDAPPPTTPPSPARPTLTTLPYTADWSSGMTGWGGSDDWSTVDGMLVSDGTGYGERTSATAPVELGPGDIAVEAEIRLDGYADAGQTGGRASFGISARVQRNGSGYGAGHCYSLGRYVPVCAGTEHGKHRSVLWTASDATTLDFGDFRPGADWHRYRLEVRGNHLTFLIDGSPILAARDNTYLRGSRLGLWSNRSKISVRSFTVSGL